MINIIIIIILHAEALLRTLYVDSFTITVTITVTVTITITITIIMISSSCSIY